MNVEEEINGLKEANIQDLKQMLRVVKGIKALEIVLLNKGLINEEELQLAKIIAGKNLKDNFELGKK